MYMYMHDMIDVLDNNLINFKTVVNIHVTLLFLLLLSKAVTLTLSKVKKTAVFRIVAINCHLVMGKLQSIGTSINIL